MELNRSIADAKTAIEDIRDVVSTLDGVASKDLVSSLGEAATELTNYLLSDAEEAECKIGELEEEIEKLKNGNQD